MKNILILFFLLCSFSAFAQYPAQPTTKQELGRQTTGDGLIYRGSGAPAYTPANNRNAWIYYDTTNNRLYKSRLGAWSLMVQDTSAFNEIQMPYIVDDTLYLTQNVTGEPLTAYVNRVWPIASLSDTTSITGENQGDVAFVTAGTAVAFRGASYWNPFSGGGGGGSFNSFDIAGDTGTSTVTNGQTVTVAGGYGINTAETGGTVTVTADTSQLVTPFDISTFVSGAVDSIAILQDSIVVGYSEGVEVTRDTIGYPAGIALPIAISDVTGLPDSLAAAPSGTGTDGRFAGWSGANSLEDYPLLFSTGVITSDANLAFRNTGGTTASRPTGAAGMMYWNTSNNWFDYHNGTTWFNPLRSSTATGLGGITKGVFYTDANGLAAAASTLAWDETNKWLGVNVASPTVPLEINIGSGIGDRNGIILTSSVTGTGSNRFLIRNTATNYTGGIYIDNSASFNAYGAYIVDGSAKTSNFFGNTRANAASFIADGAQLTKLMFGTLTADPIIFGTTNLERMQISAAGLVGIGTTSPQRTLHVTGEVRITDLTTDSPTRIVGADADGDFGAITATITTAGTTGNVTINALAGTVNIAAAGTTVTVTNSNVTANSLVFCTLRTNDTTATVKNVVPGAGSFVINLGAAATGEVSIGFFVVN